MNKSQTRIKCPHCKKGFTVYIRNIIWLVTKPRKRKRNGKT